MKRVLPSYRVRGNEAVLPRYRVIGNEVGITEL